jgi:nucleoside-diphosphate-sugar epimerase
MTISSSPRTTAWPDSATFWRDKRVVVTGGAGFLGSFIVEKLQARNAREVFVPRIEDYDLRQRSATVRYHDPYVLTIRHNGFEMHGEADLAAADCVVVVTDHSVYECRQLAQMPVAVVATRHVVG